MWSSFRETRDKVAKELNCTLEFAEGYLDGKMYRRHTITLAERFKHGMDEYARGFRTGYYMQACSLSSEVTRGTLATLQVQ